MFTQETKRGTWGYLLAAAALIGLCVYLSHCGGTLPLPCPPYCGATPGPTLFPPKPSVTPTETPVAPGTRLPSRTPPKPTVTRTPTSPGVTPSARPSLTPVAAATPFQTTGGRAVVSLDLASFRVTPNLDYYAAFSLLWQKPPADGKLKPDTPALEISIRGTSDEHCLTYPCTDTALGLVVRWSCSLRHDAAEPDEHKHVGEGLNYRNRLPIGPGPTTLVYITWGPDRRFVTVATDWASWTAKRGVDVPGFGLFYAGVPNSPKGVGWARSPWLIQKNGGTATLKSWEVVEPLAVLSRCP